MVQENKNDYLHSQKYYFGQIMDIYEISFLYLLFPPNVSFLWCYGFSWH